LDAGFLGVTHLKDLSAHAMVQNTI
jgi:hypothetical protein